MDNKALFKLPYGVFLLATKADGKANACITNTCIQVASNPVRIAISSISTNYTCELLRKSGKFTISLLDTNCSFDTIKYFGMQSGRDVDKLADIPLPEDENGIPYMGWNACCVLSAEVVDSIDLGSHFLFIAEVKDAKILGDAHDLYILSGKCKTQARSSRSRKENNRLALQDMRPYLQGRNPPGRLYLPPVRPRCR